MARGSNDTRPKMPLEDRAKIFSPFDPLQGFREALRQKEREVEAANLEEWEKAEGGPDYK